MELVVFMAGALLYLLAFLVTIYVFVREEITLTEVRGASWLGLGLLYLVAVVLIVSGGLWPQSTLDLATERDFNLSRGGSPIHRDYESQNVNRYRWVDSQGQYRESLVFPDPWTREEIVLDVIPIGDSGRGYRQWRQEE